MKTELEDALKSLDHFMENEKPERLEVLSYLRDTPLPFISCYVNALTTAERFHYSFRYLHTLGRHNVALAVGMCMNQYIAFSISALPVADGSPISEIKNQFMALVKENSWLLAVSSFDDFIRHKNENNNQVQCFTQEDGTTICNGIKNFQSNISEADVLLFSGKLDEDRTGLFYTFVKSNPSITLGKAIFLGAMADTDTRSVTMQDTILNDFQVVPATDDDEALGLHDLTRVVFSAMAMAPYLGGASRALDEACDFLKHVHIDGKPLAKLDGYVTDIGRAKIKLQICEDLIERFETRVDNINEGSLSDWINTEMPKVLSLKYHITGICEELVDLSRKIIGTRALLPSHIISRLSEQIRFAALHPVVNGKIERDLGASQLDSMSR